MPVRLRLRSREPEQRRTPLTRVDSLTCHRRRLSTEPLETPAPRMSKAARCADADGSPGHQDAAAAAAAVDGTTPTLKGRLALALRTARRTFSASSEAAAAATAVSGATPSGHSAAATPSCFSPLGAAVAAALETLATPKKQRQESHAHEASTPGGRVSFQEG